MLFTVHFTVTVSEPLKDGEFMFVSGNVQQLGEWDPIHAFRLEKTDDGHWSGTVTAGIDVIKFRYFIGYYLEADIERSPSLIVSHWETHLSPRCVMPAVESTKTSVCRANVKDIFGFNGGREMISDGWLLNPEQNQILLTIHGQALKFYNNKNVRDKYLIKVSPTDLRHREDSQGHDLDEMETMDDPQPNFPSFSRAQIAPLTQTNPKYRDQAENGEVFHNGEDYFIYRSHSVAVEFFGFQIEIYSVDKPDKLIAFGHALPSSLQDTFGYTSIPLLAGKGIIGKIYVGYLFVRPVGGNVEPQKMKSSYVKHWKKRVGGLEVGHRGMGNSYTKLAVARENTLHSLNSAAKKGADYVEFDVHLTKDKIPIIFHDFHVLVNVATRSSSIDDLSVTPGSTKTNAVEEHELAVKDLKFSQLRLLHLDHVQHEQQKELLNDEGKLHYKVTGNSDEGEEHKPFPTLKGAFEFVSEETGFNIEIKYPMEWKNGQHECANYFERNEFVDIILTEVFKNAGQRRVVFSSFCPDICTILTLKQNKYPVLFLNQGQTDKHMDYADMRTRTSEMAVRFAAGVGLAGVNLHSEDLLKRAESVSLAKHFGLITFVWGDELVDKNVSSKFKNEFGVDGIIYDRIGESESRNNIFLVERAKKQALFGTTTKKPPSPLNSPRHKQSFASNAELNNVPLLEKLPISSAALEHLDLPVTSASITVNSKMHMPILFSSAHSSTSSGISTDSTVSTTPTIRRQHCSFSQGIENCT